MVVCLFRALAVNPGVEKAEALAERQREAGCCCELWEGEVLGLRGFCSLKLFIHFATGFLWMRFFAFSVPLLLLFTGAVKSLAGESRVAALLLSLPSWGN